MSTHNPEQELTHLIKMANQIALNICIGGSNEEKVEKVKTHITQFWARPMKEKICAALASPSQSLKEELSPIALEAIQKIETEL